LASSSEWGRVGERAAADEYERRGYELLDRNFRAAGAEIDLILTKDGQVIFAEVKMRRGTAFGMGHEAVTPAKAGRIRRAAAAFLERHRLDESEVRFDVASLTLIKGSLTMEIFEDCF